MIVINNLQWEIITWFRIFALKKEVLFQNTVIGQAEREGNLRLAG